MIGYYTHLFHIDREELAKSFGPYPTRSQARKRAEFECLESHQYIACVSVRANGYNAVSESGGYAPEWFRPDENGEHAWHMPCNTKKFQMGPVEILEASTDDTSP